MLLFCGYNGFQQLGALCPTASNLTAEYISEFCCTNISSNKIILDASWSEVLVIQNNAVKIYGFNNGECGKCTCPDLPFKEKVVQAVLAKDGYIFVCTSGKVWFLGALDYSWKSLDHLFSTEVMSDLEALRILKVSCGETLTAAMSSNGQAFCAPNVPLQTSGVIDLACGKEHGILLMANGTVLTWGGGSRGQLGRGDLESSEMPGEVEALAGLKVVKVAAGGWHSAALTNEGDLYTWGWNKQGQLGIARHPGDAGCGGSVLSLPQVVELPDSDGFIDDVSCGASHTVVKLRDNSVLGCGWNKWGQLGLKGVKSCDRMTLLPTNAGTNVQTIICGSWSTFILTS